MGGLSLHRYLPAPCPEVYWARLDRDCMCLNDHELTVMAKHMRKTGEDCLKAEDNSWSQAKIRAMLARITPCLTTDANDPLPYRIRIRWDR